MTESESRAHAVYVGSFDPLTLGHLDIIERGARLFSRLTIGIGINPDKASMFTSDERVLLCREAVRHLDNVEVSTFEGLAVEFVRDCGSRILLRGVRTLADLDTEFTMSLANRVLDCRIESVFLMASERYNHISSSLIKQIAQLGRHDMRSRLKDFLPPNVIDPLIKRVQR
ncbi:MAG: pantetheine-phosphate adenylyltransferase [Planctomycetaceae bacterium]